MILSGFVSAAKEVSRDAARVVVLLVLVGISALSAVGFLTAAVFWALSQEIGSIGAALCLALVYCVITLVLFIIASRSKSASNFRANAARTTDTDAIARVVAAFMTGFQAGRGSNRSGEGT